jgi:hypothetical protein
MKCNEHIGHFTNCAHEVEALYTIDTVNHTPAKLVGFICPRNHVKIVRHPLTQEDKWE